MPFHRSTALRHLSAASKRHQNLIAGTLFHVCPVSDSKNQIGPLPIQIRPQRVETGQSKIENLPVNAALRRGPRPPAGLPVTRNTVPTPTPSSRAMRRIPVPAARAATIAATLSPSLSSRRSQTTLRAETVSGLAPLATSWRRTAWVGKSDPPSTSLDPLDKVQVSLRKSRRAPAPLCLNRLQFRHGFCPRASTRPRQNRTQKAAHRRHVSF